MPATSDGPSEVRDALVGFIPLLQDPDPAARVACYTPDAIFVQPGQPPVRGHAAMLERNVIVLHQVTLEPERIEVRDDMAYAFGQFNCQVNAADGRRVELPANFLMVLRKDSGVGWRIACEFITPVP
jgi:ketosteroid isomerase-like protein